MATAIGIGIAGDVFQTEAGIGAPSPAPSCTTGYSLEFDGITEFGKGGIPPDLGGGGTGDFTISFWMKTPDSTGGGVNQRILDVEVGGVNQWTLYVNGPAGYVQFTANPLVGGWSDGFNPYIIPNDTWVFIAYSVDRSGLAKWSVNGGSINTKNVSSFPVNLSGGDLMYLGRNDNGQYFEGNLCHIAIWNASLNLTKLGELYNNTTGLCYASDFSFSTNLKNYWPCFNPDGIFTNPLIDTVGTSTIPLINMDATNVSTDHPL
tara:strand:- start:921 stop:1706 length:786 start_codon:yes stop_codon:yes gene_type:complete